MSDMTVARENGKTDAQTFLHFADSPQALEKELRHARIQKTRARMMHNDVSREYWTGYIELLRHHLNSIYGKA